MADGEGEATWSGKSTIGDRGVAPIERESSRTRTAMVVSVLLYVVIYLWGIISGLVSLTESGPAEGRPAG